jgi:hypothetical protein
LRRADSDEHVYAQWISDHYLERDGSQGNFTMTFGDLYPQRTAKKLNQTVRVCHICNNGWMSNLEGRFEPALIAMSEGNKLEIGPDGQITIASWLIKSALVAELTTPKDSLLRVSTREQRLLVASGQIPAGWRVAIGAYEGSGSQLEHHFSNVTQVLADNGESLGLTILHTLRLECFVGQVFIHSMLIDTDLKYLLGGPTFALEVPQRQSIFWPPPGILSEENFKVVSSLASTGQ